MNVFVVGGQKSYERMFIDAGYTIVTTVKAADFVQFTGGEDITPLLYKQQDHPKTISNIHRDRYEVQVVDECVKQNKPMVGICRGAQLLCALGGGDLYQHVNNHTAIHSIIDIASGDSVEVSSTHHQMMIMPENAELIAYANGQASFKESMSDEGDVLVNEEDKIDVEAIYIPNIKALCFQPHPEMGPRNCTDYFFQLIGRYL